MLTRSVWFEIKWSKHYYRYYFPQLYQNYKPINHAISSKNQIVNTIGKLLSSLLCKRNHDNKRTDYVQKHISFSAVFWTLSFWFWFLLLISILGWSKRPWKTKWRMWYLVIALIRAYDIRCTLWMWWIWIKMVSVISDIVVLNVMHYLDC